MSRFTKKVFVKRGSLAIASLVAVLAVGAYIQTVIRLDPFASLKKTSKDLDPNLGVRFNNVHIESYDKGKLVTKADMDRMDVRQDKQHYDLFGVHDGTFFSDKGALNFEAPVGDWNVPVHRLDAPQGAHVFNKDIDLKVPGFDFRSDKGVVNIPGDVSGKLFAGKVKATNVQYNLNNKSYTTGPIHWVGKLDTAQQDAPGQQDPKSPRTWQITGSSASEDPTGNVQVFQKGIATDGDIVVLGDVIERNLQTDVVTATGHVKYVSTQNIMVCEKAVIERKSRKATMTGNVQMLVRAKEKEIAPSAEQEIPPYRPVVPDEIAKNRPAAPATGQTEEQKKLDDEIRSGKNARDFPTICYAEKIEYWYKKNERHAIITGNPQARQELAEGAWRQVWTTTGLYDGETKILKLVATPGKMDTRMINSVGDDFVTDSFQVSTKEGDSSWIAGQIRGVLVDHSDEIPREKPAPKGGAKTDAGKATGTTGGAGGTGTGGTGHTTGG